MHKILLFIFCCFSFNLFAQDSELNSLIKILENPETRTVLIEQLKNLDKNKIIDIKKNEEPAEKKEEEKKPEITAIDKVNETTQVIISQTVSLPKTLAERATNVFGSIYDRLKSSYLAAKKVFTGKDYRIKNLDWAVLLEALKHLGSLVIITFFSFSFLQYLIRAVKFRLNRYSLAGTYRIALVRKLSAIFSVVLIDIAILFLCEVIAYSANVFLVEKYQKISGNANIFLNAFIVVELIKTGLKIIFYPRYLGLRFLTCEDSVAKYWYRWSQTLITLVGYGYLVIIPFVETYLSYALAQALSTLLAIFTFIYTLRKIFKRRKNVKAACLALAEKTPFKLTKLFLKFLAYSWFQFTLIYFFVLLYITLQTGQKRSLASFLNSTLWTVITIGAGLVLTTLFTILIQNVGEKYKTKTGEFYKQIVVYVPLLLHLIRLIFVSLTILGVLASWDIFNLGHWLKSTNGQFILHRTTGIIFILSIGIFIWLSFCAAMDYKLKESPTSRIKTIFYLLKSGLAVILFSTITVMILSQIGINIAPLIAGAGVVGLAIGFGAQSLVKDVITGIFFQLDNAINTGDYIAINNNITGFAEHISIRSVSIRDNQGTLHLIPFSTVNIISNYMRGFAFHCADYGISYESDIDKACLALQEAFDELSSGELRRNLLEPLIIQGVSVLNESSVDIRVKIKTLPGKQWEVGRAFNRLVKIYFDKNGIEIPYPHRTIFLAKENNQKIELEKISS